jgi:hypothetical protein
MRGPTDPNEKASDYREPKALSALHHAAIATALSKPREQQARNAAGLGQLLIPLERADR